MSDGIREQVRERYAEAARSVTEDGDEGGGCCDSSCCGGSGGSGAQKVVLTDKSYSSEELGELPREAVSASLGCGNPTALATLSPGEVVLDLGSGGGIDVLLSARRVSPGGKAYGLDMTDEMLALARENQKKSGVENVEFLKGEIEDIPLPDDHVDVVISNCVINLSTDKPRVISEAFRVLRPGGVSPSRTWCSWEARRSCPRPCARPWPRGRGAWQVPSRPRSTSASCRGLASRTPPSR